MNITEILAQLQAYSDLKKRANTMFQSIVENSKKLDLQEIEQLSYEDLKAFREASRYMLYEDVQKKLDDIFEKKRKECFPEAYGIHYYPELKEIDFLTQKEKLAVDEALKKAKLGQYIHTVKNIYMSSEKRKKVYDFLLEKGLIEPVYGFSCNCGEEVTYISKEEYQYFLENFQKDPDERDEDFVGVISVGCFECDYKEIYSLKAFVDEVHVVTYRKVVEADTSLDSL